LVNNPFSTAVSVDGTSFSLQGKNVSYRFHVDKSSRDLRSDHFGRSITGAIPTDPAPAVDDIWISTPDRVRREFPDQGRGDFRIPAIRIIQSDSYAVSALRYQSHDVLQGKPSLPGLPTTFGSAEDVSTLVVHLFDEYSEVAADLTYSIFPKYDAIVRSASVTNKGKSNISVETLASLSVDFSSEDLDIVGLRGDWAREAQRQRRKVEYGVQRYVLKMIQFASCILY
jgi:alpha-galactosidase